jgi:hypothetical protein
VYAFTGLSKYDFSINYGGMPGIGMALKKKKGRVADAKQAQGRITGFRIYLQTRVKMTPMIKPPKRLNPANGR